MSLSMTRNGASAHPGGAGSTRLAAGRGLRAAGFRGAARPGRGGWHLLPLAVALVVLLGAAEPTPPRPPGTTHAEAVAMALELALVAPGDGSEPAGGLEEARSLLGAPDLTATELRAAALELSGRWAGRVDPARRLWLEWPLFGEPAGRLTLLERPDPEGSLARLAVVAAFCDVLLGSRHLPVGQAEDLLAQATAQRDAEAALELAGRALEGLTLRTGTAKRQVGAWREVLSVARLPGPTPWEVRLAAQGQAIEEPMALLVRVEPGRVLLGTRALISWQAGALAWDRGPPAEAWSVEAWRRWRVIARRRAAVAVAGVTTMPPAGSVVEAPDPEPLLVVEPELPLDRLAEALGWLVGEGEARACLLVREPEEGALRRACFGIAREAGEGIWLRVGAGQTAQDLARGLDEGAMGVVVP
ncbi:MAG: hypothetical protein ABIO70_27400 [Pseudomonadota bacterium]